MLLARTEAISMIGSCGAFKRFRMQQHTLYHSKLNEHAPYKKGVVRLKWRSLKLSDMHKIWPSKHLSEQR